MTKEPDGGSIRVAVLVGPTAVGKTDLALHLSSDLGLEIVSCDSRQIYRYMNIGTAKPTDGQQRLAIAWMIDIADPDREFSCCHYAQLAERIIRERSGVGKRLLVVGGSGLYFNCLSKGIGPTVAPRKEFRDAYLEKARVKGNRSIYDELAGVDPGAASATHPSNVQRNIRALEVFYNSGMTLSELKKRARPPEGMDFFVMECALPRAVLYRRIDDRVDAMAREGLLEEFYSLRKKGYDASSPGMRCVGYKELFAIEKNPAALPDALNRIKMNTRHYAKRQMTWFRHQIKARAISMEALDYGRVKKNIEEYLSGRGC